MTTTAHATEEVNASRRSLYTEELLATVARWDGIYAEPDTESRKKKEGIQIFKSRVLEVMLTKAPPILPWLWAVPVISGCVYYGAAFARIQTLPLVLLFVLGVFIWTFTEYGLHRWMYHYTPKNAQLRMFFFLTHGYHHEFPNDKMRLVAPPLMFTTLGLFFGVLHWLLFGRVLWAPVFGGFLAGYLAYDTVHYYSHHARPKSAVGKFLRAYHLRHHFEDAEVRYGISSPLWDLILGTYRGLGKEENSEAARGAGKAR